MILSRPALVQRLPRFLTFVVAILMSLSAFAQMENPHSEGRLLSDVSSIQPGQTFTVLFEIKMEEHWHAYWINAGEAGFPPSIDWELPEGFEAGEIQFPYPHLIKSEVGTSYGYSDVVDLLVDIKAPENLEPGTEVTLTANANWLVCYQSCIPDAETLTITLPVSADAPAFNEDVHQRVEASRKAQAKPSDEWKFKAVNTPDGLKIQAEGPDGRIQDVDGTLFFIEEQGIVDYTQDQVAEGSGNSVTVTLPTMGEEFEGPITGILVAPEGQSWDADGEVHALYVKADLTEGSGAAAASTSGDTDTSAADAAGITVIGAIGLAFVGGLILNIMPCVFPVLSLKIMNFVKKGGEDPAKVRNHGFMFGIGVVVSFWVLAVLIIVLQQAAGQQVGWAFQMQNPIFVGSMVLLMFLVGLNLIGAFEIGMTAMTAAGKVKTGEGYGGSFWSGVLATILATPCTAPFMGPALGYAISQPAMVSLLVFTSLGVGMALPYVILSMSPALLKYLPKPGAWMESFKQIMAFPIFLTMVWLLWVYGLQTGMDGLLYMMGGMVMLGFTIWTWIRWASKDIKKPVANAASKILAVAAIFSAGYLVVESVQMKNTGGNSVVDAEGGWEEYSDARLAELLDEGTPVFVDFTAAWCLSCHQNKKVALDPLAQEFVDRGIVRLMGDWTNQDAEITAMLKKHGRAGVPLYLLYPPGGGDPAVLPEILTPQIVLNSLDELVPKDGSRTALK